MGGDVTVRNGTALRDGVRGDGIVVVLVVVVAAFVVVVAFLVDRSIVVSAEDGSGTGRSLAGVVMVQLLSNGVPWTEPSHKK